MSHVRQQIREALATAVTGLATTGSRVYQSRIYPLGDSKLPCLLVNTDSEDVEQMTIGPTPDMERTLDLMVRCVAKAVDNLDDMLDTMAAEVETVLGAGSVMPTLIKSIVLASIRIEMDDGKESPVGVATLNYRITYVTASNAPTVAR